MMKRVRTKHSVGLLIFASASPVLFLGACQTNGKGVHHKRTAEQHLGLNSMGREIQSELTMLAITPQTPQTPPTPPSPIASEVTVTLGSAVANQIVAAPTARPTPHLYMKPLPKAPQAIARLPKSGTDVLKKLNSLDLPRLNLSNPIDAPLVFDIPVTYNDHVRRWIRFFQTDGRVTFKNWLERSARFLPVVQFELSRAGLPQDLVYVAMIESGFTPGAVSHAGAMGMWQFIVPTAERYGLRIDWWIDERKDFMKATRAAVHYMGDLHNLFNSWYLVAASYNMGENGVRRLLDRHHTHNFWELADKGALPQETSDYVPKIIAAMLIAKAPALYGFRGLDYQMPLSFESISVPGGTDMVSLAAYLGVSEKYLKDLNPELIRGLVPIEIEKHTIRVPKGSIFAVSQYIRLQAKADSPIGYN